MSRTVEAVNLLPAFIKSSSRADWEKAKEHQAAIVALERDADKIKSSVRQNLPKSLFMPVSRSDLLELVDVQDRIANGAKDIAGLMLGRKMVFPDALQKPYAEYLEASVLACRQALGTTKKLARLMELSFGKRQLQAVEAEIRALSKLERKSDKLQVKLRARLFKLEHELTPVDVMFLYRVIDLTGELADNAEKVGNRMLILVSI
jgi:predicted phosphate transport protein (TIGR00153 family)